MKKLIFLLLLILLTGYGVFAQPGLRRCAKSYQKGDYETALKQVHGFLLKNPDDEAALFWKAEALFNLERYEEAIRFYLMSKNTNSYTLGSIGNAYFMADMYDSALVFYEKAVTDVHEASVNNNIAGIYYNTAETFSTLFNYDSARYYYQKAIAVRPSDGSVYVDLGLNYRDNDEGGHACANYFIAAVLGNEEGKAYYERENCISWQDQWIQLVGDTTTGLEHCNKSAATSHDGIIPSGRYKLLEKHNEHGIVTVKEIRAAEFGILFKLEKASGEIVYKAIVDTDTKNPGWKLRPVAAKK